MGKIADNPGGKVVVPAFATTAYTAEQPQNMKNSLSHHHVKKKVKTNAIKREPVERGVGATEQEQWEEGAAEILSYESHATASLDFQTLPYPNFK